MKTGLKTASARIFDCIHHTSDRDKAGLSSPNSSTQKDRNLVQTSGLLACSLVEHCLATAFYLFHLIASVLGCSEREVSQQHCCQLSLLLQVSVAVPAALTVTLQMKLPAMAKLCSPHS